MRKNKRLEKVDSSWNVQREPNDRPEAETILSFLFF